MSNECYQSEIERNNSESKKFEGVSTNNEKLPGDIDDGNIRNSSLPSIIELKCNPLELISKYHQPVVIRIPTEKREVRLLRDYQAIFTDNDVSVITPCEQITDLNKIKSGNLRAHRTIIAIPTTSSKERHSRLLKEYKNLFPNCDFQSEESYDEHLDPEALSVGSDLTTHEISCSSINSLLPSDKIAYDEHLDPEALSVGSDLTTHEISCSSINFLLPSNKIANNETNRDIITVNQKNDKSNESLLNVLQFELQNLLCNCLACF